MWSCRSLKVPPACLNRAMRALEIGDFKEDVGAALARASSGEVVTLTQEGQPVAELGPVRSIDEFARGLICATGRPRSVMVMTSPAAALATTWEAF